MEEQSIEQESAYQRWLRMEGLPVIRDYYIEDIRAVPLEPWERRGGSGVYLNLIGTGDMNDATICEIPPGRSLNPERYLFEEMVYVASGRGGDHRLERRRQETDLRMARRQSLLSAAQHLEATFQRQRRHPPPGCSR